MAGLTEGTWRSARSLVTGILRIPPVWSLLACMLAMGISPAPGRAKTSTTTVAFVHVTVIDVRTGQRLPDQTVVITGNRIGRVAPSVQARVPKPARVVQARGKYLIPGLWDMHVHAMRYADIVYPLLLANGVTGMRDAGSETPLDTLVQWKRAIAAGTRVGPRLVVSGPAIDDALSSHQAEDRVTQDTAMRHHISVPISLVPRVVDSLHSAGADMVKTYFMPRATYFAIAAEARRVGMFVGGHVPEGDSALDGAEASDSGATFLDHVTWFRPNVCGESNNPNPVQVDTAQCAAHAQRLRRNNTWVTLLPRSYPTRAQFVDRVRRYIPASIPNSRSLTLSDSEAAIPYPASTAGWAVRGDSTGLRELEMFHRAGLPIVIGTDANVFAVSFLPMPGFSVPEAMVSFVLGGMTTLEALQAATLNPALALRATDSLGTVEPGKVADLVLLDADPLADIWNTTKIHGVVANGRYFDRAALDQLLATAQQVAAHR